MSKNHLSLFPYWTKNQLQGQGPLSNVYPLACLDKMSGESCFGVLS